MDLLTGEGEASYFRLDLGSLVAQVAYTKRFGPIMAGPVPIVPFVGGSISVEGRLAMGFDSRPQTLAVESLSNPGDVDGLIEAYGRFDDSDIITEGFYLDDLDADGVDVPEVKIVTTLEAGAGVSIGIVTAGLKGGITLTINLDINDPNDDGRLRTAEINTIFAGKPECVFDVSADLEAFISIFISIELLFTSLDYSFDLLRLGPYTLFEYGCPDLVPVLVRPGRQQPGPDLGQPQRLQGHPGRRRLRRVRGAPVRHRRRRGRWRHHGVRGRGLRPRPTRRRDDAGQRLPRRHLQVRHRDVDGEGRGSSTRRRCRPSPPTVARRRTGSRSCPARPTTTSASWWPPSSPRA